MTEHGEYDEEVLGRLLGALPPAPADWVEAAAQLPETRRDVERIVALAEADAQFAAATAADLEAALRARGFQPSERLLAEVRRRLRVP